MNDSYEREEPPTRGSVSNGKGRRRSHVIPKFHLKLFAIKDIVCVFDIELARIGRKYRPVTQSVNNATVIKGFYTDQYEDRLSQRFEEGIKAIMEKIVMEQKLRHDERLRLSRYIYVYRYRSPWMLRLLQNKYDTEYADVIREYSQTIAFLESALYNRGHPIDEGLFAEMGKILADKENELADVEAVQSSLRSFFSGGPPISIEPGHADMQLASLPWRVLVSKNTPFALGDHFFELYGQDQPIYQMYFPISSTHCLFISRFSPNPRLGEAEIEYIPVDSHAARAINVRTAKSCERFVVSGQDSSWVEHARRTPSAKHLQLRIPSVQTQELVGGYISQRCPQCWWALATSSTVGRELESIENDMAVVQTFKQRACSNPRCDFVTAFDGPHEKETYPLGVEASNILQRIRLSDRYLPTIEEAEQ